MASTEIYPTIDGSIRATSGTSWNAVRDATSGTAATTGETRIIVIWAKPTDSVSSSFTAD